MVRDARTLYSSAVETKVEPARAPWEVARDMRWKAVRGLVVDPIALLGTAVCAWALARTGAVGTGAALLGLIALATTVADDLLFRRPDGDLLRVQPLGPTGFLRVRQAELEWWMRLPALLAAAAAAGAGGAAAGGAALVAGWLVPPLGLRLALTLRGLGGRRAMHGLWLLALGALAAPLPHDWWVAAPVALLALAARPGLEASYRARFDRLASDAATAPRRRRAIAWPLLSLLARPLPGPLRARVVRDATLLVRGRDPQGLVLLLLSPLSCLLLRDELATLPSRAAMPWRVLTCAALGGAAVAYAIGPGLHRIRIGAMAWERTAPRPGRRAVAGAMAYAIPLALLHGGATLATLAAVQGGRFAPDVGMLALPVLGLEASLAWFVVAFVLGAQSGRRITGEGTLTLSLPVVGVGVAIAGVLMPALVPAFFVLTAPMLASAARRFERVEVTW